MKFLAIFLVLNASKSTFGFITSEKESINYDPDMIPQRELQMGESLCAVDGEKSLDCGSGDGKQSCCPGLVCHAVQTWRCVTEEEKFCGGPGTLAQKCGSKWDDAAEECCDGLTCDGRFCIATDPEEAGECAIDGEKSLGCGSKKGKQSCCPGLVCHEVQTWRCVIEENKFCGGPNTLAQTCGSDWEYAAKDCCDGLVCDGRFCVTPPEDTEPCAVDGEKSLDCGAQKGLQSCCRGLICHETQFWRCVSEEKKSCSGPNTLSKQCGSEWEDAEDECCDGLICSDSFCVQPEEAGVQGSEPPTVPPTKAPTVPSTKVPTVPCDGENMVSGGCGANQGTDRCCAGLVCHDTQVWRCVKEENRNCAGEGTLAETCGARRRFGAAPKCCDGHACVGKRCYKS